MSNQIADQINELTNKIVGTATNLQEINNEVIKNLVSKQISGVEGLVSLSTKQLEELKSVKTSEEAITAQTRIITEVGKTMQAQVQDNIDILNNSRSKLEALINQEVNEFIQKAKSLAS